MQYHIKTVTERKQHKKWLSLKGIEGFYQTEEETLHEYVDNLILTLEIKCLLEKAPQADPCI